jgi:UDP-N-acetyl-D-glucosamine/UDP-N-acetyl-D-galactosamine dehydrogenase
VTLKKWDELPKADAIVAAVAHNHYKHMPVGDLAAKVAAGGCFVDVKSCFPPAAITGAGLKLWRL